MTTIDSENNSEQLSILAKLQATVSSLKQLHQKTTQEQTDNNVFEEIAFNKISQKHTIEIQSLKDELNGKNTYIMELEDQIKSQNSTFITNFKHEFTHLEMVISEKQAHIESLQKQVLRQKQKISQLESQIDNQIQERQFYENNFKKLIETSKGQLRKITSLYEQNDITNLMSLTIFKKFSDRIEIASGMRSQNEMKTNLMKEKYMKLKKDFSRLMEKANSLQMDKQRLSEKLWTIENGIHCGDMMVMKKNSKSRYAMLIDDNFMNENDKINSKLSIKSKHHNYNNDQRQTVVMNNKSSKQRQLNYPSTLLLQKLDQTLETVIKYHADMEAMNMQINEINNKITQQQQVWSQVLIVKEINTKLKDQLNQLKQLKGDSRLTDQLLKQQHPTLFNYFNQKMSQIQTFQTRLQKIEQQSVRIIQLIEKIMYEGLPEIKPIEPSSKQLLQQQNIIKQKIIKQLQQKFDQQKDIYQKQIENYHVQKHQALGQEINRLNKQVERLKIKNQDMYKLINQMEQYQQQIQRQIDDQNQQQSVMNSNKKSVNLSQTQLNPKVPSPKQQIDKQLLSYLQKKSQDLELQLNEQNSLMHKYKKELRFILQNYRVKNTKYKQIRCNECLFSINNEKGDARKCEKCRVQYHQNCYKEHEPNCKRRTSAGARASNQQNNNTKKNPPQQQKKKTSNHLANSTVSQNMDYF